MPARNRVKHCPPSRVKPPSQCPLIIARSELPYLKPPVIAREVKSGEGSEPEPPAVLNRRRDRPREAARDRPPVMTAGNAYQNRPPAK